MTSTDSSTRTSREGRAVASKNDLSAYKTGEGTTVLQSVPTPKRMGRPPAEEKRTFKVTLSFTEAEGRRLKEKAGLVPMATYLLASLEEAGVLE